VFPAKLSDAQSRANTVLDRFGKRQQVPFRRSHPIQRLFAASRPAHQASIPVLGYHEPGVSVPRAVHGQRTGPASRGIGPVVGEGVVVTDRTTPCGLVSHKGTVG
jgi:hypothetical protein